MATARINLKSIDYFKFKKLVIDGNRDDYNQCSKEVKVLCDYVQTLRFRDEEFDDLGDRSRFEDICDLYKQILTNKRIDSIDMRIKSGWWGDHKNAYSAGKIKPAALRELLVQKAQSWISRHPENLLREKDIPEKIEGPGLYVFKHRENQCFQYVGMAQKILQQCAEKLKFAFDGSSQEPLAALLLISMSSDWDFYFLPVAPSDGDKVLRVLENDLILKHDSIWPHGLNFHLNISSLLEVSEFRQSCLRHHWPPEGDVADEELSLKKLREQVSKAVPSPTGSTCSLASNASEKQSEKSSRPTSAKPRENKSPNPSKERPKSAKAAPSRPSSAAPESPQKSARKLPSTPKPPTSPAKRPVSAKTQAQKPNSTPKKSPRTPDPPQTTPPEEAPKASPKRTARPAVVRTPPPEPQLEPEPEQEPEVEEAANSVNDTKVADEPKDVNEDKGQGDNEEEAGTLKRQGTYEVLPTDENDEVQEKNYVPDSPQESDNEMDGKAVRPTTLERPDGSRLPIITN